MAQATTSSANFSTHYHYNAKTATFEQVKEIQPDSWISTNYTNSSQTKTLLARFCSIWQSQGDPEGDEKDTKGRGRKVPSGFEKILKRTRKGITHDTKEEKEASSSKEEEGDSVKKDKESEDKKAKEDEQSDDEKEEEEKTKDKKKEEEGQGYGEKVYGFFFEPNGGGPNWENWLKLALLGGISSYYTIFAKAPSQEVTYMDFVNNYLSQNKVELITLCEEKNNASYKYRAVVQTFDGEKVHLVLP